MASAAAAWVVEINVLREKAVAARRDVEGYIVMYLERWKAKYRKASKNI
jgi:hypothetical protein